MTIGWTTEFIANRSRFDSIAQDRLDDVAENGCGCGRLEVHACAMLADAPWFVVFCRECAAKAEAEFQSEVRDVVCSTLRETVAVHQRKCAIHHGVRESSEIVCTHSDWNHGKQWCNNCGMTLEDAHFGRRA